LYAIVVGEWQATETSLITYSFTVLDTTGKILEESFHPITPPPK